MAYVITSPCQGTCDTECIEVCPCDCIRGPIDVEAIRAVPAEDRASHFPRVQMFIDPDECIDCGACLPECPVEAIYLDSGVPGRFKEDIQRNADFFARRHRRPRQSNLRGGRR